MGFVEVCPDGVDESVEGLDCGSNADGAAGEYVGAQTATVDKAAEGRLRMCPCGVGKRVGFTPSRVRIPHPPLR